jgi:hypothetical protein
VNTPSVIAPDGARRDSIFCELLDDLAPEADGIVVIIKSYFDESYDDRLLCVAGYSFTNANARHRILRRYRSMCTSLRGVSSFAAMQVSEIAAIFCTFGFDARPREWVVGEVGLEPTKA